MGFRCYNLKNYFHWYRSWIRSLLLLLCLLLRLLLKLKKIAVGEAFSYTYCYCFFCHKIDIAEDIDVAVDIAIEENFHFAHFCKFSTYFSIQKVYIDSKRHLTCHFRLKMRISSKISEKR